MAVTGRATVFAWRCAGERPAIVRQFAQPDAAGYLAHIWYPIDPASLKVRQYGSVFGPAVSIVARHGGVSGVSASAVLGESPKGRGQSPEDAQEGG